MTKVTWNDIEASRMEFLARSLGLSDGLIAEAIASNGDDLREELAMALDGVVTEFAPAAFAAVDWWASTDQPHPMNLESILDTAIQNGTDLGRAQGRDADDVAQIAASFAACVTHILVTAAASGLDFRAGSYDLWDDEADQDE